MGLDVTAYKRVTLVRAMTVQQANAENYDPWPRSETLLYVDHPCRTQHDGMVEGAYAYEGAFCFHAGSYHGYNLWRNRLADLVGVARAGTQGSHGGPFAELIHFADNDGFIGPRTAAKLAADFDTWRDRASGILSGGSASLCVISFSWWFEMYECWSRAFHLAANGGAVQFD